MTHKKLPARIEISYETAAGDAEIEARLQEILQQILNLSAATGGIVSVNTYSTSVSYKKNDPESENVDIIKEKLEQLQDNLSKTTKGQRLRLKGGRLVRTQISFAPDVKKALERAAKEGGTSASVIVNNALENDPQFQLYLDEEPE